jgi:hypothetical protein
MRPKNLVEILETGNLEEKIEAVRQLSGTLDRTELAAISRYAYFSEITSLRQAAEETLRKSSINYIPSLSSYFYVIPWDSGNIFEREDFEALYLQVLKRSEKFSQISAQSIKEILRDNPSTIVIFRAIAGYTLDEISFVLNLKYDVNFSKDHLQTIERQGSNASRGIIKRWNQVVDLIANLFYQSVDPTFLEVPPGIDQIKFRLLTDKFDTRNGWSGVTRAARERVSYQDLLYQRYIGGTFRQARDISSSLKADILEGPIEHLLRTNGIPFYKTEFREKVEGWDQAPDFFIPNKEAPKAIIEAKVAEDGGTARDKAARIKVLAGIAKSRGIGLISVVDGKGFRRINDVLLPIIAYSYGLIFSYSNKEEILNVPVIAQFIGTSKG